MHLAAVLVLMFVLPTACVLAETLVFQSGAGWMPSVGRWFVFWAVGVRCSWPGASSEARDGSGAFAAAVANRTAAITRLGDAAVVESQEVVMNRVLSLMSGAAL